MRSTIQIITPAVSCQYTTLAMLKAQLNITDTTSDIYLSSLIDRASHIVSDLTGRVWQQEEVIEKFYARYWERIPTLVLKRRPISIVTSVVENNITLVEDTDFVVDYTKGMLYRINGFNWPAFVMTGPNIVVHYTGGFALLDDLPYGIEQATLILAKAYWFNGSLNPTVRSETTYGIDSVTYRDIADAEKEVMDLLNVYSDPGWA